jgi:hypothetical protein
VSKDRREQIYQNLIAKETDYLLEIWQNLDPSQWEAEVPEILKEILSARLRYVPPQSIDTQLTSILDHDDICRACAWTTLIRFIALLFKSQGFRSSLDFYHFKPKLDYWYHVTG